MYGDSVMIKSLHTNGYLAFDMGDRINSNDEAYAVTGCEKIAPCARAVYTIVQNVGQMRGAGAQDGIVRYGDEIRIMSTPHIYNKPLYLNSCQISPLAYSRFTRNQEVCLHTKPTFNTVWKIKPSKVGKSLGDAVHANDELCLEHCGTVQNLSTDRIPYVNDFGNEMEVSCMTNAKKGKTQMLAGEYNGEMVRE